jgi:hypothetical protein
MWTNDNALAAKHRVPCSGSALTDRQDSSRQQSIIQITRQEIHLQSRYSYLKEK